MNDHSTLFQRLGAELKFSLDPIQYELFFDVEAHRYQLAGLGVTESDIAFLQSIGNTHYIVFPDQIETFHEEERQRCQALVEQALRHYDDFGGAV